MRYLVCGDTGFIGSNIIQALIVEEQEVLGISSSNNTTWPHEQCDILNDDFSKLKKIVDDFQPDRLLHFASYPIVKNYDHIAGMDTVVTHKLLDATPKNCKFVFASSVAVYGQYLGHETYKLHHEPKPISVYAQAKLHGENLVKLYAEVYKRINGYSILRFCGHIGDKDKGVIKDIIDKIQSPSPYLELLGDEPGSLKPYIHIDDSVRCVLDISKLTKDTKIGIYNICPDTSLTVKEIAEIIMEELAIYKPIIWTGNNANWNGDGKTILVKGSRNYIRGSKEALIDYMRNI